MAMPCFLMLNLRICVYVSTTCRSNSREEDIWLVLSFFCPPGASVVGYLCSSSGRI